MRQLIILLVVVMQMVSLSAYSVTPVKTKDNNYGKKVTLYPLDDGHYNIEGLTVGNQQLDVEGGKLYYAEYGDGAGVLLGIKVTLKDGRQDYISFSIADFWKAEKDEDHKGVVNIICSDENTYATVYALNAYCQGLIIFNCNSNTSILVKYSPRSLVRVNPVSALEKILDLDEKYTKR